MHLSNSSNNQSNYCSSNSLKSNSSMINLIETLNLHSNELNKKMQKIVESNLYHFTLTIEQSGRIDFVAETYPMFHKITTALKALIDNKKILTCVKHKVNSSHHHHE